MDILRVAKAGTLESNDILVMVTPGENGTVELELESIVMKQFGPVIREEILETVKQMGVNNVRIVAQDKGALDYTVRARVETALKRAAEPEVQA